MTRAAIRNLIIVVVLFVVAQGWILYAKFHPSGTIVATQAYLTGQSVAVGTPVSGIVQSVNVAEGKHVEKGQPLFLISQQSTETNAERTVAVVAQQAGTVYGITVIANSFVQASQVLAHIIDGSPEGQYVQATVSLDPQQLPTVALGRAATVTGPLLNEGKPVPAVITSVGLYDGQTRTVDVRLRLMELPVVQFANTILKLPVDVTILSGSAEKTVVDGTAQAKEAY